MIMKAPPVSVLGKRSRNVGDDSAPSTTVKSPRANTPLASYPTPELTQQSSPDLSGEEQVGSQTTQPEASRFNEKKAAKAANKQIRAAAAVQAKANFLADLRNFVPLGSLTVGPLTIDGAYVHSTEWNELGLEMLRSLQKRSDWNPSHGIVHLMRKGLARVFGRRHQITHDYVTLRVYVLPDDIGGRYMNKDASERAARLKDHLGQLFDQLDISFDAWEGCSIVIDEPKRYNVESSDKESLFYLFNKISSPKASFEPLPCQVSNEAIESVLHQEQLSHLTTRLFSYQRRTVATMIQREVRPGKAKDPRFQKLRGPTGQTLYYDNVAVSLLRDGREYEGARGGILGESMGLGKTLICLAAILATQGHWPDIPPEFSIDLWPVRPQVGSLVQMAAASIGRAQIPWRPLFREASRTGEDHQNLINILEANVASYVVPPRQTKYSRRSSMNEKGITIRLSAATLIIVPQNLLSQWRHEIAQHVVNDRLHILYLDTDDETRLPLARELSRYDIVLMSRPRLEREMVPSKLVKPSTKGRRAKGGCMCSLDEDCDCSRAEEYHTPLKDIHWLRIIMDEGHEFSASGRSSTISWALRELRVDRKWIVSGTPSNGLMGVEVGTAIAETPTNPTASQGTTNEAWLESRRNELALVQEQKDLDKLGVLVTGFLQVRPWANSKLEDPASWQQYIMPYKDGRRKAGSLKNLLESLVIRHRIEDIESEIQLPPLYNRVKYLSPSWHDKLSINLFVMLLTANAVTSERQDEDYMFHPKNRKQLNILINNLRQAGFYWTGISPEDVEKTLKVSRAYLEKQLDDKPCCSPADRLLLEKAINTGSLALDCAAWRSFAELHEMGVYLTGFPEEAASTWSLIPTEGNRYALTGATHLSKAYEWTNSRMFSGETMSGLAEAGKNFTDSLWRSAERKVDADDLGDVSGPHKKTHRRESRLEKAQKLTVERTVSRPMASLQIQNTGKAGDLQESNASIDNDVSESSKSNGLKPALKSILKKSSTSTPNTLPPVSPLANTKICGTASAKLSYLLDRISELESTEKILIFYESDQVAWYIAQAMDLIGVRYLIYTKTLSLARQTAYITTFNKTETFRVLLMNVHQAAHGLHIASASRVFFVNPVWQPNVEAQAIKRAHRIGQTLPVYVETLVLEDTLEDIMFRRRKQMSAKEHQQAERSVLDDRVMDHTFRHAEFVPYEKDEVHDVDKQMATLDIGQRAFACNTDSAAHPDDADNDLIFPLPLSEKEEKERERAREHWTNLHTKGNRKIGGDGA